MKNNYKSIHFILVSILDDMFSMGFRELFEPEYALT